MILELVFIMQVKIVVKQDKLNRGAKGGGGHWLGEKSQLEEEEKESLTHQICVGNGRKSARLECFPFYFWYSRCSFLSIISHCFFSLLDVFFYFC